MSHLEALRHAYSTVARQFHFEADKIVRRQASRQRLLELFGPHQAELGWSDDDVFDTVISLRKSRDKKRKLPPLRTLLASEN